MEESSEEGMPLILPVVNVVVMEMQTFTVILLISMSVDQKIIEWWSGHDPDKRLFRGLF